MRAAIITNPLTVELREAQTPALKSGEIRVRLQGCGVCGSNVPPWEGRSWFRYPLDAGSPGHEGWGIVAEVASDVHSFVPGDRVAFLSEHAFAEYDVAPASNAVHLPPELDDVFFPAEPLGCAMNVLRRCQLQSGESVAIIGVGFLGAVLTRLAVNAGACVVAISRRKCALDIAKSFGAAEVVSLRDTHAAVQSALQRTGGRGYDCVIEAVGTQESLDLASELTRERGRLVIAGYHQDGPRRVNMQLWNWRGLDVINAHEREPRTYVDGMQRAIDAVLSGALDLRPLFTHTYSLAELACAFAGAQLRPEGFLKALVIP
jgi:threonine dehydrogenase-like Zn-dependent dehydrogenase